MKMLTMVLLLLSISAHAADRQVRTFLVTDGYQPPIVTGDTVPAGPKIHTLLFLDEPCPLGIVGAETMHRAWQTAGAYQLGCWYPTLRDEYTYINGEGRLFHSEGIYWQAYPRGVLHDDGSVTITEPNFDSSKFFNTQLQRIAMDHLRRLASQAP